MLNEIENDFRTWFKNWKITHLKSRVDCNLEELGKHENLHKYLSYSFTLTTILLLSMIVELFINNKVSITYNTLLIMSVIALYDELQNLNNTRLFIYLKKQEVKKHEII